MWSWFCMSQNVAQISNYTKLFNSNSCGKFTCTSSLTWEKTFWFIPLHFRRNISYIHQYLQCLPYFGTLNAHSGRPWYNQIFLFFFWSWRGRGEFLGFHYITQYWLATYPIQKVTVCKHHAVNHKLRLRLIRAQFRPKIVNVASKETTAMTLRQKHEYTVRLLANFASRGVFTEGLKEGKRFFAAQTYTKILKMAILISSFKGRCYNLR